MKYFIEGNLLAVGVVDMVDDGLSSVYFFYDPKYKECRLGVFSSLIEIEYVRWMRLSFPEFRNYYMGFYISNS
jgi:arginine-tRNA-protein transferase